MARRVFRFEMSLRALWCRTIVSIETGGQQWEAILAKRIRISWVIKNEARAQQGGKSS